MGCTVSFHKDIWLDSMLHWYFYCWTDRTYHFGSLDPSGYFDRAHLVRLSLVDARNCESQHFVALLLGHDRTISRLSVSFQNICGLFVFYKNINCPHSFSSANGYVSKCAHVYLHRISSVVCFSSQMGMNNSQTARWSNSRRTRKQMEWYFRGFLYPSW